MYNLTILLRNAKLSYEGKTDFYDWNRLRFSDKAQRIETAFKKLGFDVIQTQGGYFTVIDIRKSVC